MKTARLLAAMEVLMKTGIDGEVRRLTDRQILEIFQKLRADGGPRFLEHYAEALAAAPRRDFLILRPVSLILITKYRLTAQGANNGEQRHAG
jgi:hypothetical protein